MYVIACVPPTVPNWMLPPLTVPLTDVVPPGLRWMVPFSFEPLSVQVNLNAPEKAPLYWPDHVPNRPESDDPPVGDDEVGGVGGR